MDNFDMETPAAAPAYDPAKCLERLGKLTASKAGVIMGGLDTSGLATYVKSLAWERVYGARDEEYRNAAMDRGNELEPRALDWYESEAGLTLTRTPGFMQHPTITYVGASPDALVCIDREATIPVHSVQVKCPLHGAWMETKRTMQVPAEYRWQCRWEQWVSGVKLCDFVTWHPVAGGLIVPISVTQEECKQMAERAAVVDAMVQKWVAILTDTTGRLAA